MFKKCTKCEELKPLEKFDKHPKTKDGLASHCKECKRIYKKQKYHEDSSPSKQYYQNNRKKILEKQKEYQKTEAREKSKKKYNQSEKGKNAAIQQNRIYRLRHPEKRDARFAVHYAVRMSKLPKVTTLKCAYKFEGCTGQASDYHHYAGYEKENWLKVIPTCRKCHLKAERIRMNL